MNPDLFINDSLRLINNHTSINKSHSLQVRLYRKAMIIYLFVVPFVLYTMYKQEPIFNILFGFNFAAYCWIYLSLSERETNVFLRKKYNLKRMHLKSALRFHKTETIKNFINENCININLPSIINYLKSDAEKKQYKLPTANFYTIVGIIYSPSITLFLFFLKESKSDSFDSLKVIFTSFIIYPLLLFFLYEFSIRKMIMLELNSKSEEMYELSVILENIKIQRDQDID